MARKPKKTAFSSQEERAALYSRPDSAPNDIERPEFELPPEFNGDESEFLKCMRDDFANDEMFDHDNHASGVEDLQFLVGDQWDAQVKDRRILKRKPVLTVNRLPAFVAQIIGNRLQNETVIKVLPDNGGTREVAKVREGLMRAIQKNARSVLAYDNAYMGAVTCGIGNFQLELDYESEEVWHQSIGITSIPDHFSVVWDRSLTDSTGADATRAFVVETMPYKSFVALYPWATPADIMSDRMPAELLHSNWYDKGDVRIVSYWSMRKHARQIALLQNGATVDITDEEDPAILDQIVVMPNGKRMERESMRPYACMYRCSGADVLEGPYQLQISRIPIFRVPGWEIRIGTAMHRWGIIRHMKDPQRLHNFWRSAIAEKIMQAPKNTWLAADTAVAGRESKWRTSHTSDDPLLIWNAESGQKPEMQPPVQVEQALIVQAELTSQDLKDVSNIHEANLGMPSNEVSGAAINARVRVTDTGTALYQKNMERAIEECGRTMNELIPNVYDTPRTINILGDDANEMMQAINMAQNPNAIDITLGKYRVTVITGPSTATKRIEAAESMMGLAQAMPQVFTVGADLLVEALDWPGADKLAERIRRAMPPGILGPTEQTQETQIKEASANQAQQLQVQMLMQKAQTDNMKAQSESMLNFARAKNYNAQADAQLPKVRNESLRTASEAASRELRDHLATIEVAHPAR